MKEAMLYSKDDTNRAHCRLCPHMCLISPSHHGICGVRENRDGKLYSLVYGKVIALHVDPIEKKPLYHFYPGSHILSFATAGCNMKCTFCQNWEISQASKGQGHERQIPGEDMSPEEIIDAAEETGCKSIAMTYNEPTIFFEFAYDTCVLAKKRGIRTVFVSNGYISEEAIDTIAPYLDAINIDLKGFTESYYRKLCGARLKPVLDSIRHYHNKGVHVEVTTLIVPGENDDDAQLKGIADFLASVDSAIPWHISRFHPDYKMLDKGLTSDETMQKAYDIGKRAGLRYIYMGNMPHSRHESTHCHRCGELLVERTGYRIGKNVIQDGKCPKCKEKIPGLFY